MTEGERVIREVNDAIRRRDFVAISQRLHPDVVWRHNIGVGTPEEGEYEGRDRVIALFERILEPWEYMRMDPGELREAVGGVFMIKGELRAKHWAADTEIVAPYEQRIEIRGGVLVRGEVVSGPGARLADPEPG